MKAKKLFTLIISSLTAPLIMAQSHEASDSLTRQLQEIIVTSKQPATKLVGSTLVSTIPGSNLAYLGNALDVLAQLPMIKVDDNSVSVIGKSDIEIYIDGRPMRDDLELQQLLSSNLKKVELLLTPGASYASTTGAVLKITTRRNFAAGLSVNDIMQLQRRRKWSVMEHLALNYRFGAWDYFVEGSFNRNNSLAKGTTANSLTYNGEETKIGSSQCNSYPTTTGVVKAGFNYAGNTQSFGAYYRYNPECGNFNNSGTEWLDNNSPIKREIDKHISAYSHLASIYYENTFADRFLLHLDGDMRLSRNDSDVATTYPESATSDVKSDDRRSSTLFAGKLTLNFPLSGGEFAIGTQDSYTHSSLDYRMLNSQVGDYIPSSVTDASQTSAALFASWSRSFGKISLTAGARYEYVDYDFKIDGQRDENVSRRDHLLTPDLSLAYSFNDNTKLNLSYKLATVKPPYSQLTGSLSYVGMHEIEGGNPALHDERMHDIQLFGFWRGFMIQADYIRSFDTYAYVKQLYPADNLQLLTHPVNIDLSALSIYLVWSRPIGRWTPNVTGGMYRQWLTLDSTHYSKPIFSYYFDNTLSLPRGWMITVNINGRSQGDMHTNRFGATWLTMDASIGKSFFSKTLSVKLSATDIFNSANYDWTMRTYGISVDKRQSYDRRGITLNITYSLHPQKSKYKGAPASASEANRLE